MQLEQVTMYRLAREVMGTPVIAYNPDEIAEIQAVLGLSDSELGGVLGVSVDSVKAYKRKEGAKAHRYPSPSVCKLLHWCAFAAKESPSALNNRIRLSAKYGKNWRRRLLCDKKA